MLERLLDALASLPLVPTYLVLMVLSALENVFPPVPADTAVALGAFLARRGEISVVPLAILCWLANLASACADGAYTLTGGPIAITGTAADVDTLIVRLTWTEAATPPTVLTCSTTGVAGTFAPC